VQATVDPCHRFAAQPSQLDSHSSCFNFFHPYISILTAPPSLSHIHDRFVTSDTQSISSIPLHCDLADDRSRPSRQYQLPNPSIATTSCAQANPAWLFPLRPPGLSWSFIPLCSRRRSLDSEVLGVSSTPVHLTNSLHRHWNPPLRNEEERHRRGLQFEPRKRELRSHVRAPFQCPGSFLRHKIQVARTSESLSCQQIATLQQSRKLQLRGIRRRNRILCDRSLKRATWQTRSPSPYAATVVVVR
jgi:hypothetical protein